MPPRDDVRVITEVGQLAEIEGLTSPVYLIGGAQLYKALLPQCDEVLLTFVTQPYEGDVLFPPFEEEFVLREVLGGGEGFEFRRYTRK
jgi:dihydrofolate reductase